MTGHDTVTWLVRTHKAVSREEAVEIGQAMLLQKLLHHVTHEHSFGDNGYFFMLDGRR